MRPSMRVVLRASIVLVAVGSLVGCNAKSDTKQADAKTEDKAEPAKPDGDAPKPSDEVAANFADPKIEPPPAPAGSLTLKDPWLYVQTCAEPHPCPDLMQPAGDAHCRDLELAGHVNWRLPSKDEVARFRGVEGLEARAGYHWTRTPFEDDMGQVWIVDPEDPEGAPATTIPRDRKPFRIRCVREP